MTQPTLTLDVWRSAAVALCEHACGYDRGRSKEMDRQRGGTKHD